MSSNFDNIQAAGSDTRPLMLDRTDYEPWSQRIRLYCRGKENEIYILQSIDHGLPKDIYKLINHNIEATTIWDNVKMLLAGSELTKEDRESQLYDELECFKMLPGENINEYYDRFVTGVKLNKGLKETNHEQLYAYLKQHEKHAAQDRLIIEKITLTTNDPLAFVSNVQPYAQLSHVQSKQHPSFSTPLQSPHVQSLQYSQFPESSHIDSGYSHTDEIIDTLTKQVAFLAQRFRLTLPQTNNQL
ncbi:hypothetical protein Tco_0393376 [Tanacetum coccineum]